MTSLETGPSWSERLNPRHWTLVWKLLVVGLVPALLALTLGALRISDQAGTAAELGADAGLLRVRAEAAEAADALRQERDAAALFVAASRIGGSGPLGDAITGTDTQLAELRDAAAGTEDLAPTARAALEQAEAGLAQLAALRDDVRNGSSDSGGGAAEEEPGTGSDTTGSAAPADVAATGPTAEATDVLARYSDFVTRVDALDRALLRQLRAPQTAGLADALTAVNQASEALALQHSVLGTAIRAGRVTPEMTAAAATTERAFTSTLAAYQAALTPEQVARFGDYASAAANAERGRVRAEILATPADRPVTVTPAEWDTAYQESAAAVDQVGAAVRDELVATSAAAEEQASNQAGVNSVLLMLGLLVAAGIAILVGRNLLRSLRVLRTSALDVAERRLPLAVESMRAGERPDVTVEPVPLTGRDEVVEVARAFDAVHGQAVRLAADQAALQANVNNMFVNLSRRSQALVERQLQLIEQLESNEQDPDQLSNLFQLDHLATRMRRNSENLLVLAGTDLAKRNIAPVPMVDVLRAAVSEIEQYQRIVVQPPPKATIVGRAASDIVHLLAELLDNATNFSPPDSQVVMSSARTPDGSIVVEIADRGVGMVDHELSDANQRLSSPSAVDVSASRRMGLFVVGRLAGRHGLGVRLGGSGAGGPGGGLTATVTIPAYLVPSAEATDGPSPAAPRPAPPAAGSLPGPVSQLPATNGTGHTGSLSSLVAGTDGPSAPATPFDVPAAPAGDADPLLRGNGNGNGTPGLPTRHPGSTLRTDGPAAQETPPADEASAAASAAPGGETQADAQADVADTVADTEADTEVTAEPTDGAAATADPRAEHGATADTGTDTDTDTEDTTSEPASDAAPPEPPTQAVAEVRDAEDADGAGGAAAADAPQRAADGETVPPAAQEAPSADRPAGPPLPVRRRQPTDRNGSSGEPAGNGAPAPARGRDGLFAPSGPGPGDEQADAAAARPGGAGSSPQEQFERGETTPIFEEIASAWFRSNRPIPVNWRTDPPRPAGPQPPSRAAAPAPSRPSPRPAPPAAPSPPEAAEAPPVAPAAAASPAADAGFASQADEGWRAASGIEADDERSDGVTSAGLPKRRPRARLVPGSAGSAVLAPPVSQSRSPESIRGRLASYQQGVRQGRDARQRRTADPAGASHAGGDTEPATAGGHHDEESR